MILKSLNPAKFYIIPNIDKSHIAGSPIAASHSFITRAISISVDDVVKPSISMPTVLRDSGELQGICHVYADVSSLYPNIDTKKANIALELLLREGKVAPTAPLVQFTRLVFENNYCLLYTSDAADE